MSSLAEAFVMFMLHEYLSKEDLFLVTQKIKKTFNCEITTLTVRGWYKLFEREGISFENSDNHSCTTVKMQSARLIEWINPSNSYLFIMCKELTSFPSFEIKKILYDEIWISYAENSYKFERRYEVDVKDTKDKQLVQVWWETGIDSFMSPIGENATIEEFCDTVENVRSKGHWADERYFKHILLINSRNPLLTEIYNNFREDYNILALPPNFSRMAPMNHFDQLYEKFDEFLKNKTHSNLEAVIPAFSEFCKENLSFFESVFDNFCTCCELYKKVH